MLRASSSVPSVGGINQLTLNSANLYNFRKAAAKVQSGGRARIMILGDSTTTGAGAGTNTSGGTYMVGARTKGFPTKLAQYLTQAGLPTYNEAVIGTQNVADSLETYTAYDPRVTTTFGVTNHFSIGNGMWSATSAGATWAFTPTMTFDRFDVYYPIQAARGSLTANVDGGATLATIVQTGASAMGKTTVSCTRGTHTINLATVNATMTEIYAVVPWDSTVGGFDILQGGWYGGDTTSWSYAVDPWSCANPQCLPSFAPDIVIVQMVINDSFNNPVTAFASRLALIDTAITNAGAETIWMSGIPSNPASVPSATAAIFQGAVAARAAANSRVFADLYTRDGGANGYAINTASGWMRDNFHGTALMYADEGWWLSSILQALIQ